MEQFLTDKKLDELLGKASHNRATFDFSKLADVSHLSSQYFSRSSIVDPATNDNISNGYSEDYQEFPQNQRATCTQIIHNFQDEEMKEPEVLKESVYPELGDLPEQFEIPESCENSFKVHITDT